MQKYRAPAKERKRRCLACVGQNLPRQQQKAFNSLCFPSSLDHPPAKTKKGKERTKLNKAQHPTISLSLSINYFRVLIFAPSSKSRLRPFTSTPPLTARYPAFLLLHQTPLSAARPQGPTPPAPPPRTTPSGTPGTDETAVVGHAVTLVLLIRRDFAKRPRRRRGRRRGGSPPLPPRPRD